MVKKIEVDFPSYKENIALIPFGRYFFNKTIDL